MSIGQINEKEAKANAAFRQWLDKDRNLFNLSKYGKDDLIMYVEVLHREIADLQLARARYETARRMTPRQWAAAWELNLKTGKPFDEIIDDMQLLSAASVDANVRHGD